MTFSTILTGTSFTPQPGDVLFCISDGVYPGWREVGSAGKLVASWCIFAKSIKIPPGKICAFRPDTSFDESTIGGTFIQYDGASLRCGFHLTTPPESKLSTSTDSDAKCEVIEGMASITFGALDTSKIAYAKI